MACVEVLMLWVRKAMLAVPDPGAYLAHASPGPAEDALSSGRVPTLTPPRSSHSAPRRVPATASRSIIGRILSPRSNRNPTPDHHVAWNLYNLCQHPPAICSQPTPSRKSNKGCACSTALSPVDSVAPLRVIPFSSGGLCWGISPGSASAGFKLGGASPGPIVHRCPKEHELCITQLLFPHLPPFWSARRVPSVTRSAARLVPARAG
jgi:hypothetical protein